MRLENQSMEIRDAYFSRDTSSIQDDVLAEKTARAEKMTSWHLNMVRAVFRYGTLVEAETRQFGAETTPRSVSVSVLILAEPELNSVFGLCDLFMVLVQIMKMDFSCLRLSTLNSRNRWLAAHAERRELRAVVCTLKLKSVLYSIVSALLYVPTDSRRVLARGWKDVQV